MKDLNQHFDFNNSSQDLPEGFIINSVQLCEIINQFREEEGDDKRKTHDNLLKDIRRELKYLANAGIEGLVNFNESSYLNTQNRKQPCFVMTKAGAM